jgi:hypothetical protein
MRRRLRSLPPSARISPSNTTSAFHAGSATPDLLISRGISRAPHAWSSGPAERRRPPSPGSTSGSALTSSTARSHEQNRPPTHMARDRSLPSRPRRRTRTPRPRATDRRDRRRRVRRPPPIRRATTDVDVITALDDDIRDAAAAVAGRHELESDWLKDRARPWQPSTFDLDSCHTALVHGALEVLMPVVDDVILMKIAAGNRRPND